MNCFLKKKQNEENDKYSFIHANINIRHSYRHTQNRICLEINRFDFDRHGKE